MDQILNEKKAKLLDELIDFYTSVPFGTMSKSSIDAYVFGLLEQCEYFKDCETINSKAIKLKITPTKFRTLMLNSILTRGFVVDTKDILNALGTTARNIENNYILFEIDNPVIKMALKDICCKNGILTDSSFNSDILKLPISKYELIMKSFIPKNKEKEFNEVLWKKIREVKSDIKKEEFKKNPIAKFIGKVGENVASETLSNFATKFIAATILSILGI